MILPNLTTNMLYEVKVRAASISTIKPNQLILGAYSEVKKVCFDVDGVSREELCLLLCIIINIIMMVRGFAYKPEGIIF